jgi:hypothetical protein
VQFFVELLNDASFDILMLSEFWKNNREPYIRVQSVLLRLWLGSADVRSYRGRSMSQVLPLAHSLDPDAAASVEIAYENLTDRFRGEHYADLRQIIAERLIAAARSGERDPEQLSSLALASLGFFYRRGPNLDGS